MAPTGAYSWRGARLRAALLQRGRSVTTVERRTFAVQHMRRTAGHANPCVPELRKLLSGARRIRCEFPDQKFALRTEELRAMVAVIGTATANAARNCAILLFGFASALRRSSIAGLLLEDISFYAEGLIVRFRGEKQDRNRHDREAGAGQAFRAGQGRPRSSAGNRREVRPPDRTAAPGLRSLQGARAAPGGRELARDRASSASGWGK